MPLSNIDEMRDLLVARATIDPARLVSDSTVNPAKWMHERIVRKINTFEERLDADHEVGGRLVSFGPDAVFHIENVGFWGPDMITFEGFDRDGRKVELLQHITQLSVLLVAVNKVHEKPRRIGFEMLKSLEKKGS
jgi:hypothetical protein